MKKSFLKIKNLKQNKIFTVDEVNFDIDYYNYSIRVHGGFGKSDKGDDLFENYPFPVGLPIVQVWMEEEQGGNVVKIPFWGMGIAIVKHEYCMSISDLQKYGDLIGGPWKKIKKYSSPDEKEVLLNCVTIYPAIDLYLEKENIDYMENLEDIQL